MISHLDGTVSAIAPEGAVIEVGGVADGARAEVDVAAMLRAALRKLSRA